MDGWNNATGGLCKFWIGTWYFGWLIVFNVPSTATSFRDDTPIYCPLGRTWSSMKHRSDRAITWQSISLPLRYASSTEHDISWMTGFNFYSMICWLKIWANELIKAVYFLRFEHLGTIARNIKDFYLIFMKYL